MLAETTIQIVAASMGAVMVSMLVLSARWTRPLMSAPLRAGFDKALRIIDGVGIPSQVVVGFYPLIVAAFPSLTYGTVLQWSFPYDEVLQVVGIGLWVFGAALALWSFRFIGPYLGVKGVATVHQLVTSGPYARIRHPVYASVIFLFLGVALTFQSYLLLLLLGPAVAYSSYRAREEEAVLASPAGFGEEYLAYMARTGRFLPRLRK